MLRYGIRIQMELRTLQVATLSVFRDRFLSIWELCRAKLSEPEDVVKANMTWQTTYLLQGTIEMKCMGSF